MKYFIAGAALLLAGCSTGSYQVDSTAMDKTDMVFAGIPTMLGIGMMGTVTPINSSMSLTNKHVAYPTLRRIIAAQTDCDIALIKRDNADVSSFPKLSPALLLQQVTIYGFSGRTGLPVSSRGKVLSFGYDGKCLVAATNAGSVQGMSGGGVFNDAGDLVGIFYALEPFKGISYFIPTQSFEPWLTQELKK